MLSNVDKTVSRNFSAHSAKEEGIFIKLSYFGEILMKKIWYVVPTIQSISDPLGCTASAENEPGLAKGDLRGEGGTGFASSSIKFSY